MTIEDITSVICDEMYEEYLNKQIKERSEIA